MLFQIEEKAVVCALVHTVGEKRQRKQPVPGRGRAAQSCIVLVQGVAQALTQPTIVPGANGEWVCLERMCPVPRGGRYQPYCCWHSTDCLSGAPSCTADCFPCPERCHKGIIFLEYCTDNIYIQIRFSAHKQKWSSQSGMLMKPIETRVLTTAQMWLFLSLDPKIVSKARKSLRMACLSFSLRQGVELIRTLNKRICWTGKGPQD